MSRARIYHFLFSKHLLFQYIVVNNLIFSAQLNFDFKKIRTATTIKRESDKFDYIFKKKIELSQFILLDCTVAVQQIHFLVHSVPYFQLQKSCKDNLASFYD